MTRNSALSLTERGWLPVIAYYRVSTMQQGVYGLGLETQRAAVLVHVGPARPRGARAPVVPA